MNIHEETLKIARNLIKKDPSLTDWVISKFPELKENEESRDEMIRKSLSAYFAKFKPNDMWNDDFSFGDIVAWLDRQGKQKQLIERGKWYVCIETYKFFVKGSAYQARNRYCMNGDGDDCFVDDHDGKLSDYFRPWAVKDAKDGDVLYSLDSNQPFIYKERKQNEQATAYCGLNIYGKFFVWGTKDCVITLSNYVPATKEQREQLEKAMADAGYEWDAEKKELKKIEQNAAVVIPKFRVGDIICPKGSTTKYTIESISGGCYCGNLWRLPIGCDDDYELVEQKPADKVEPKFHEGEWITNGDYTWKIVEVKPLDYILKSQDGNIVDDTISHVDEQFHSFTIQDAKDGDVLASNDGHGNDSIELIKSITDKKIEFWFCLSNGNYYEVFDGLIPYTNLVSREDATPATKEQRDLLFKKMKEAGYEWDVEKKGLKKIEPYSLRSIIKDEPSPAIKKVVDSLSAWSEEDERYLSYAIHAVEDMLGNNGRNTVTWLKSLKDRYTWKPSYEQMKALEAMLTASPQSPTITSALLELREQLKKLKE